MSQEAFQTHLYALMDKWEDMREQQGRLDVEQLIQYRKEFDGFCDLYKCTRRHSSDVQCHQNFGCKKFPDFNHINQLGLRKQRYHQAVRSGEAKRAHEAKAAHPHPSYEPISPINLGHNMEVQGMTAQDNQSMQIPPVLIQHEARPADIDYKMMSIRALQEMGYPSDGCNFSMIQDHEAPYGYDEMISPPLSDNSFLGNFSMNSDPPYTMDGTMPHYM